MTEDEKDERAVALVKESGITGYVQTTKFIKELKSLFDYGHSDDICREFLKSHSRMDVNGMDKDTNYVGLVMTWAPPKIHPSLASTTQDKI